MHHNILETLDDILNPGFKKCTPITRADGTQMVFFNPPLSEGGGWKMSGFRMLDTAGNAPKRVDGFEIEYTASVEAYCKCGWDDCFKIRKGTRKVVRTFDEPHDFFVIFQPEDAAPALPGGVPLIKGLISAIGEIAAETVKSNLPKAGAIYPGDLQKMKEVIAARRPKNPTDGKWVGGHPCAK